MKVFISWSGDLSRELAEALRDWLPAVLQSVKPFFTPNDVEKGARWGKDIAHELQASAIGIFCLTKENLTKPWLMFEAGALSKELDSSRVCPVLFGVDSADLEGPLVQFQASPFSETEMRKLIRTMNGFLGDQRLTDPVVNDVFNMWWPKLNEAVKKIIERHQSKVENPSETRSDRDLLEEILELARLNATATSRNIRRVNSTINDSALRHAFQNILSLCEHMFENNHVEFFESIKQIYDPLKYIAEKNGFKDNDERLAETIRKIDSILAL